MFFRQKGEDYMNRRLFFLNLSGSEVLAVPVTVLFDIFDIVPSLDQTAREKNYFKWVQSSTSRPRSRRGGLSSLHTHIYMYI